MRYKAITFLLLILLLFNVNLIGAAAIIRIEPPKQNDMGSDDDAGATFDEATEITVGYGTGYVGAGSSKDYYKIPVTAGQTIRAELTSKIDIEMILEIYDSNTLVLDEARFKNEVPASVSWTFTYSGFFYIMIARWDVKDSATYTLAITASGGGGDATSQDEGDNGGWEIPGYPMLSVMIGILAGIMILALQRLFLKT